MASKKKSSARARKKAQPQPPQQPKPAPVSRAHQAQAAVAGIPLSYSWALGIFVGLTAIIGPYGQTASGYNPDLHMASYLQVGSVIFLLVYLLRHLKQGRDVLVIPRSPSLLPLLLLFLWMVISIVWAHNFYEGVVKIFDWLAGVVIFLLVLFLVRDKRAFFPVLFCLFVCSLVIGLLGVGQYLLSIGWVQQHAAPAATFGNKNMAGEYLILTIPLGFCLFLNARKTAAAGLYAFGVAIMLASLFYGRTRGSWLGFLAEIFFMTAIFIYYRIRHQYKPFWNRNKTYALLGGIALLVVLVNLTPTTFLGEEATLGIDVKTNPSGGGTTADSFLDTIQQATAGFQGSKSQRFTMWLNSFEIWKDYWLLGTGIGNWMVFYPKYQAAVRQDPMLTEHLFHINAHNDYIEIFVELGIVGALLMLWLAVVTFRIIGVTISSRNLNDEGRVLAVAPILSILGIGLNASFSFPMQQPITISMIFLYLGLLSVDYRLAQGTGGGVYRIPLPAKPYRYAAVALLGFGVLCFGNLHYQWFVSETHYRKAAAAMRLGKHKRMESEGRIAREENPMRKYLNLFEGSYYMKAGQYGKAIEKLEKVREDYPYRVQMMHNLAASYLYSGQPDRAQEILEVWTTIQPHSREAFKSYGLMAAQIGQKEKAIKLLKRAQELFDRKYKGALAAIEEKKKAGRPVQKEQLIVTGKRQVDQVLASLLAEKKKQSNAGAKAAPGSAGDNPQAVPKNDMKGKQESGLPAEAGG